MALKKAHATALEDLLNLANRFYKFSGDVKGVEKEFKSDFEELMKESNTKITLVERDGLLDADVVELQRDFLKVVHKNEENISIKSKTLGVEIEVKVWRQDKFEHTNEQIRSALLQLAEQIEIIPTEAKDIDEDIVIKGIDLFKKTETESEDEDLHEEEEVEAEELEEDQDEDLEEEEQEELEEE
ncbi:hypothetical protein DC914_RS27350 [Vibrio parahaemolyticus]|uniref:hypothetical protein n=1 Tax=Vibrio parahaemolyticus TaxID=670 RepID=UPI0006C10532|nr:hypothetical protein [Vibrio parahaemolyticus]KOY38001.1 hypothetical protein ACX10_12195 [Vibrio parahaemolyticus]